MIKIGENNCSAVWLNQERQAIHKDLSDKGLTSQSLKEFAKSAFDEKVDRMNIAKITHQQIEAQTLKANPPTP